MECQLCVTFTSVGTRQECLTWLADRLDRLQAISTHIELLAQSILETIQALRCID